MKRLLLDAAELMFLPSIRKEKNQVTFIANFIVSSSFLAMTFLTTKVKLVLLLKTPIKPKTKQKTPIKPPYFKLGAIL